MNVISYLPFLQTTVNKRFNVMLEPLQLNRRRQGNVGDMMLTAVQQTQEDMDSLSLELRNYKEFTAKLSELTDVEAETDENIAHVSRIEGVIFWKGGFVEGGLGLFVIRGTIRNLLRN